MSNQVEHLVPDFAIFCNRVKIPLEAKASILRVEVSDDLEASDMFSIVLSNEGLKWIDADLFAEGTEVRLDFGYVESKFETMIIGEITSIEPVFRSNGRSLVTIRGYDRLHRLRRGKKVRSFQQLRDSEIAEQIARELDLRSEVDRTEEVHEYLLQNNLSDIEFLKQRARRIGYEVVLQDRTLHFRRPRRTNEQDVTLKWGESLINFDARLTTMEQVSEIIVRGWNPVSKRELVGRAQSGDERDRVGGDHSGGEISTDAYGSAITAKVDQPIYSQAEADSLACSMFDRLCLGFVSGEGSCIGTPSIRSGNLIELEGIGERFSGSYYLNRSDHIITRQGYTTRFSGRRNAT